MTDHELSWLSLEPTAQDLEWQRYLEENRRRIINAFALPSSVIGEAASSSVQDDERRLHAEFTAILHCTLRRHLCHKGKL